MQIQVNTDNHINGGAELTAQVEKLIQGGLARYGERVTRVEVHLSDENSSSKAGATDKRCVLEVRLAGVRPVSARDYAETVPQAVAGAVDKVRTVIDRELARKG